MCPARDRGRKDGLRIDSRVQLDFRPVDAWPDETRARYLRQPLEPMIAVDRDAHHPPARRALDLPNRTAHHDAAAVGDRHGLAHRLDGVHLVGREDDGLAPIPELQERLAEERDVDGVEARKWLVHEQDLGVVQDRGQELDLLLVALR